MLNKNKISAPAEESSEVDVGRIIGSIIDHKWLIIAITALFAIAGIVYCFIATPVYQANALVQVEQDSGSQILNNLSSYIPDAKPQSTAEIELIQSRMVIGKTVEDLALDTTVNETYFPIFGKGWARLTQKKPSQIAVSRFSIPESELSELFKIKVKDAQHYELIGNDGIIIEGVVNQFANNKNYSILVSEIDANPGTTFTIQKSSVLSVITNIQKNLLIEDTGKDTGVLSLTYTGTDKNLVKDTLNSITQNYLLQNVERKSEEAEKSLQFLTLQIPKVRAALDEAENKLNSFRQENDSVDLSLEAKSALDTLVNIDSQLNELTFKESEISKLYTKEHPAYRTLLENRKTLENEKANISKRISAMPKTQQEILRLTRDVQTGQIVYTQLVNKQQELNITKASTIGNVRIVDTAITLPGTVAPQKAIIIAVSVILGLIVSVLSIFIKTMLYRGIENATELEEAGINVYASVPLSEWQQNADREIIKISGKKQQKSKADRLLALSNPTDMAIESVRSLRTSLHFAMMEAKNNILMICGASPAIGKTFISTNLAVLIAQTNQRVLFIDADLRKGYVHDLLGLDNKFGLSELLSNQCTIEQCIQHSGIEGFHVITRGQVPPNPSELLMSNHFDRMLEEVSPNYDLVLMDTPPILAVTDAAIIGRQAGTTLLVVRYGVNTLKEIEISINRFAQNGTEVKGVILNSVYKKARNAYSSYGYYEYEYKSTEK